MRNWTLRILGTFGVLLLLLGVFAFALTQTVSITPFSWNLYWQSTELSWFLALVGIPAGFAAWRYATRELRSTHIDKAMAAYEQ